MARRFLVAGLGVALVHAVGAALSLGASGRLAGYFAATAVATALMSVALHRLLRGAGPDGGDGGDGGVSPPDDLPPPWWPQFEADLREYAGARGRTPSGGRDLSRTEGR